MSNLIYKKIYIKDTKIAILDIDITNTFFKDIDAVDPLLVKLIKEKKIDPWDIDILYLANNYLSELAKIKNFQAHGKMILTAAILLNIKADYLELPNETVVEETDDIFECDEIAPNKEVSELEQIPLLIPRRRIKRRLTLPELINILKSAIKNTKSLHTKKLTAKPLKIELSVDIKKEVHTLMNRLKKINEIGINTLFKGLNKLEFIYSFLALLEAIKEKYIMILEKNGEFIVTLNHTNQINRRIGNFKNI
jgi:segregation and condensation protein A